MVDKIKDSLPDLVDKLKKEHNKMYWLKIASAIMTTDTKPKVAYSEIKLGEKKVKTGRGNPTLLLIDIDRHRSIERDERVNRVHYKRL